MLIILGSISLFSQSQDKLDLFIDCNTRCYFDYIKQNITFVDHSLERMEADVFVLITGVQTASGGREIQMVFQGSEDFDQRIDTLSFNFGPNDTDFIRRDVMVEYLKKGLLPYIIQTPLINKITYSMDEEEVDSLSDEVIFDPWNYWVYNIRANGWTNGESSFRSLNLNASLSASRITEESKFRFSAFSGLNRSTFTLTDGETFVSEIIDYNAFLTYVKSLNQNWSLGFLSEGGSSTFSNMDVNFAFKPAVEYNIYPYDEVQTKRFTFRYSIGPEYYNYTDSTVFNKLNEWVGRHSIDIEFFKTQKMGDFSIDFGVEQYLHNPKLYNVYFDPSISWQLFKGFRVWLSAFVSWVNDRINIPKDSITDEDILLQIRQLDTQFRYFANFGVSYRFGSLNNNFVNARF
ncbi:MAG: hypothetical protein AAF487_01295 [Bacteroidota bacterium]